MRKKTLKRGWIRFKYSFDYKWVVLFFLVFASIFILAGFDSEEILNFSVADVSLDWFSSSGSLLTGAVTGFNILPDGEDNIDLNSASEEEIIVEEQMIEELIPEEIVEISEKSITGPQGDLEIQTSVLAGANSNVTIYWFNDTFGTLNNDTEDANDQEGVDDVAWWLSDSTTTQAIFGHSNTFNKIYINVSTTTFADYVGGFEYWDGSFWATLSVTNETQIFRTLDIHPLSFTAPVDWATTTIDGQGPYYFVIMNCTSGCGAGLGIAQISLSEIASDSTKPNVTTLIPAANSVFNVSNVIEIAANVTDGTGVSKVFANVTYPNGTINQLTLANASTHNDKFNVSFTVPGLIGAYNITFIANDTTNNINSSESSNFTVSNSAPVVSNVVLNATDNPLNRTNANLTLYWDVSDADGDAVKNITDWKLNGASIAVLNMPFEKNATGANTKDYSNSSNDGTVISGATWNATGGYGGSGTYNFDVANDYINVANGSSTSIQDNISISFWLRVDQFDTYYALNSISKWGDTADANYVFYLFGNYSGDGQQGVIQWFANRGGEWGTVSGGYRITNLSTWHHVGWTYNSAIGGRLYINGVAQGALTGSGVLGKSNATLQFGADSNALNGSMDELMIFNRSLTANQILNIYNNRTDLMSFNETSKGDVWRACATGNDGTKDGPEVCSNNVMILNSPPVQVTPFPDIMITKGITDTNNLRTYFSDSDNNENYSIVQSNDSIANLTIDYSSLQLNITGVSLGSISTYINVSDGEYEIQGSNFTVTVVSAPGSTGSGGSVVTGATSPTTETAATETAAPISAPKPIVEKTTTAEEVTTLIKTGKITAQVTTAVQTAIPQTITETTAMTEQTSAATKSVSSEPITTTEQITISLTNTGDKIITLQPELGEDTFVLENEEMVEETLKNFILNLASLEDEILTEEEVQQKVIEEKKIITLIEKENVQPLFKEKTWSLADFFKKEATIGGAISAGEAAEQTEIVAMEPIAATEEVKISFTNQEEGIIYLQPELEEKKIVLENESQIVAALREELIRAGKEEGKTSTEEEIEKKVNLFKLIERENIQPIFKKKSFSFLDYSKPDLITGSFVGRKKGITHTGQQITGKLLESYITGCDKAIVQPGESVEQTCIVQRGISAESQPLKIIFKSSGENVLERQVDPQASGIGAAVDVDKVKHLLELYLLIPKIKDGSEEFNDYFLEITINEPSENISEESKSGVLFADLYGPYKVREDKGFVFAQQLESDPAVYFGNKFVETKLFKNNKLVAQHGFAVDLGESDGQLETLFSNKTIYQALVLLSVFLILLSFVGLSFLMKKYNVQIKNINFDNKLIVRIILVSVLIILLLSIGLLGGGDSRNSYRGDLSFDGGIIYTGQHITGKLLESHLEDCGEIIIKPGESFEKTCTVRRGISAGTAPLKITFKAFGEKVLERQVDPQASGIGAAVDVDKDKQLLDLYMLIPKIESGSEEFNNYFLEITINELFGEIYEQSKSSVLFTDLYGPYLVRQDKGFVFAQQLEYDPAVYFGNKFIETKLFENNKLVAQHGFSVNFGGSEGRLDSLFTNRLSFWALLIAIILLVFVPGFVFLYLVRKHRLK